MGTAKVQAGLRIRAVSPEPMLFAHISSWPRENLSLRTRHGLAKGQGMHTESLIQQKLRSLFSSDTGRLVILPLLKIDYLCFAVCKEYFFMFTQLCLSSYIC